MPPLEPSSRRRVGGWLLSSALVGLATPLAARNDNATPIQRLPRHYSLRRFLSLSRNQVYRLDHAARLGKQITIEGYTPSQTRRILRDALVDWPAVRQSLQR